MVLLQFWVGDSSWRPTHRQRVRAFIKVVVMCVAATISVILSSNIASAFTGIAARNKWINNYFEAVFFYTQFVPILMLLSSFSVLLSFPVGLKKIFHHRFATRYTYADTAARYFFLYERELLLVRLSRLIGARLS